MFCWSSVLAQTSVTTTTTFLNNNGSGTVTFNLQNTNGYDVIITDIEGVTGSSGNVPVEVWYKTTPLNGSPGAISTANGWVQIASSTITGIANTSTTVTQSFFTGLSFNLPANTTYAFAVYASGQRYYSLPTSPATVTLSAGGVNIITGANIGYGGGTPPAVPGNTPRGWIGTITFVPGLPCTAPPTGGIATTTNANPCTGSTFDLGLTGNSIGTGQTYQWEESFVPGGPYTPIAGATSLVSTITATTTKYYRCAVTCSFNTQYSLEVQVTVPPPFPSGTYTINSAVATGSGNFQSFTDAVSAISCGIAGPIIFNVVPGSGPYNEQITIPTSVGSNATNTVTFNGNGDTLTSTVTTSGGNYATINLDGADYITFNNLVIQAMGPSYGFGVHLMNSADNNTFHGCTINTSPTATGTTTACVSMSGSTNSYSIAGTNGMNNSFDSCMLSGGYFGFSFYGSSPAGNSNNNITRCTVQDYYVYGSYNYQQDSCTISGNTFERPNRTTATTFYGVLVTTGCVNMMVAKNWVRNPYPMIPVNTSTAYGFYCTIDAVPGSENKFINNLISDFQGNGTHYGMYFSGADYIQAYHNTISFDNTAATAGTTYGLYSTGTVGGMDFKNNVITISRGGTAAKYCVYFTGGLQSCDNNDLYMNAASGTSNNIGYFGTAFSTLTAWKGANSGAWDQNSVSVDPQYVNPASMNYTPSSANLNDLGTPLGVTTDITGAARSATNPDPGAYEFVPPPCVAPPTPGTAVVNTTGPVCASATFTLSLTGNSVGFSQTYQWEESFSPGGPYIQIGTPSSVPFLNHTATATKYYRCGVTCNFNTQYSNDVLVSITPALPGGTYTINSAVATGGGNYQTFADAVSAISCGISGPVVFNVATGSGPYNEQIEIPDIINSSSVNTVTFNGNGATITQTLNTTGSNYATINLNGADHVIFNNLIIEALGTYGFGVHLMNSADSNRFYGCTINASMTATGTTSVCVSMSGSPISYSTTGNNGMDNSFDSCALTGGYFGFAFYGNSNATSTGNNITNCTVQDFYAYGSYFYQQGSGLISGNIFERPTRATVTTFYGVLLTTGCLNMMVEKNRVRNPFAGNPTSTSTAYALYCTIDGTLGNENKFINNLVSDFEGNGTHYGMYFSGADYIQAYHNTISFDYTAATAGTTYGLYSTGTVGGMDYRNNIITISRGGTGTKYAIYFTGGLQTCNYNNIYMNAAAGTNYVGYFSTGFTTLANWQTANSGAWDQASVSLDPVYSNPTNNNYVFTNLGMDNMGTPVGVTTDILGLSRDVVVPDMGAYEVPNVPCTAPPVAGTANLSPTTGVCGGASISAGLMGNSLGQGQTYQWEESLMPGGPYSAVGTSSVSPSATITATTSKYYRCAVTCGASTTYSTEVFVSVGAIGGTASILSDTICYGGTAGLSLSGHTGDNVQWESYDSGTSSWLPISGATTSSYSVNNVQANTSYRAALSCTSPTGTVYSDTVNIVVLNPSIVNVFPGSRCDAGPVTLAAEGATGTTVKWYDAMTAGNLLGTGNAFTSPVITSTTTYYAAAATGGGSAGTVPMPAHGSNYNGNVRGMWFTAPVAFTITGLQSLAQTTGNQSIAVVKFNAPPPAFSSTTNAFTVLYLTQNNPATGSIPVNIQINAGDIIGVLSQIATSTSYATPTGPYNTTIGGLPVTFTRLGMQFQLGTTAPQDLWEEPTGAIGRTEITYQIGCEGARVPVAATITGLSSGTGLAAGGTTVLSNQTDGATVNYNDGCNDKVATVVDAVGGNVLGNTYAVAVTTPTVQTFNNIPYVPRVFDITPTNNGPAVVTLYALQSEFNAYNSYVTTNSLTLPLLPTGPTDPNISNIVITQFHGSALAASTGPLGLYDAQNSTFITNNNITVAWTGNYWTMTFPVTGFSGFFIHSGSTPLLIDLAEISAVNVGKRNRVDWSTASEQRGDVFELQRSGDGDNFTKLTEINAKGEASSYSYWDENPISGVNHYRLKMFDATGKFSYSKVVTATLRVNGGFVVEAYPNPVSDVLTVHIYGATGNNATVTIADVTGKVIRMVSVEDNKAQISMNGLAQGVYLVKYADSKQSQTIKVNKQ